MRLNTIVKKLKTAEVIVSYSREAKSYCCMVPLLKVKLSRGPGRPSSSFMAYGRTPDLAMKNFAKAISGKALSSSRSDQTLVDPEVTVFNKATRRKTTKTKRKEYNRLAYKPIPAPAKPARRFGLLYDGSYLDG